MRNIWHCYENQGCTPEFELQSDFRAASKVATASIHQARVFFGIFTRYPSVLLVYPTVCCFEPRTTRSARFRGVKLCILSRQPASSSPEIR